MVLLWIDEGEAASPGPVPCAAFVNCVVFSEIRNWVTLRVGDDALQMIDGQCRQWHSKAEAEYVDRKP